MARKRATDRRGTRIELPSGRIVEVAPAVPAAPEAAKERLRAAASRARDRGGARTSADSPHICAECESPLAYPVAWRAADSERWSVDLRCPNCERSDTLVLEQRVAERFDEELERGAETLARDLARLAEANMADDIERFVTALEADGIQPIDF